MAVPPEVRVPEKHPAKTTFSFDSSGWLYVYHLGVAQYLQKHILPKLPADRVACSGSSGGALVAAALCGGVDIEELTKFVIACQPECEYNPWRMLPCADEAIAAFLPRSKSVVQRSFNRRLRVLVTRIELRFWRRWLIRPQAVSKWDDYAELAQTLRASCHIPVLGGVLPYRVTHTDGTPLGAFYDGLFWPSILYTWRAFDTSDTVLKVSGFGWPMAHIRLPLPVPPHWLFLPPSQRTLWRLYAAGYDDAARYFGHPSRHTERTAAEGGGGSPSAPPPLPSPKELPPPPRRRDPALLLMILLGWLHLLVLTLCAPLVPLYCAVRHTSRPISPHEQARLAAAAPAAPSPATPASAAEATLRLLMQLSIRGAVVVATFALWPLALLFFLLRLLWPFEDTSPLPPGLVSPVYSPVTSPTMRRASAESVGSDDAISLPAAVAEPRGAVRRWARPSREQAANGNGGGRTAPL